MKKFSSLLLIICLLSPVYLFANTSISDLSPEEAREFFYSKLSYDTRSGFIGGLGEYGTFSATNYKYWIPYKGTEKIREHTFFEIAGYYDEATKARSYEKARSYAIWGGLAAVLGGLIISGMNDFDDSPGSNFGLILALGGSVSVSIGASMYTSNRYPSNIADMVADDYNSRLLRKLASE